MPTRRRATRRGELEADVLGALWDSTGWRTPAEVHEVVGTPRGLAYTTVMTALVRLWEKQRLERRPRGRAYEYRPVVSRTEDAAERMHRALDAAGDPRAALAHFVGSMDDDARAALRRELRRRP